jgi:hypothetical protein
MRQNGAFPWGFGKTFSRGFFVHPMQTHPHLTALRAEALELAIGIDASLSGEIDGSVRSVCGCGITGALDRAAQIAERKRSRCARHCYAGNGASAMFLSDE